MQRKLLDVPLTQMKNLNYLEKFMKNKKKWAVGSDINKINEP